jgi:opacity protein-like surface antigen
MTLQFSIKEKITHVRRLLVVVGVVSLVLGAASVAVAHPEDSTSVHETLKPKSKAGKGFYLGLQFNGSSLHVDENDEDEFFVKDDGGGFQLRLGYRFNYVFALELDAGGATHETSNQRVDAEVGFVQLFAIYRFAPNHSFRPYIKGGLGGYGLSITEGDLSANIGGGGIAFGGGFEYYFSRHFALGVDLTLNMISYNKLELNLGGNTVGTEIDEEGSMSALGLSLGYYF